MKPETKRRLAIEWLTLLCSIVVGIVAILWAKVPHQIDDYWKSGFSSAWFRDITSGNAGDVDGGDTCSPQQRLVQPPSYRTKSQTRWKIIRRVTLIQAGFTMFPAQHW
jgi:hypothetical protein